MTAKASTGKTRFSFALGMHTFIPEAVRRHKNGNPCADYSTMPNTIEQKLAAEYIPGYTYGTPETAKSPLSLADFERLKQSAGFTEEDERYLRMAGEVLAERTKKLVDTWRTVISRIPHLARHS